MPEEDTYTPEYAEGEILVCFSKNFEDISEAAAVVTAKIVECELSDEAYRYGDHVVIYKTEPGMEDETVRKLEKLRSPKGLIDWVKRRDLKLETRAIRIDNTIEELRKLAEQAFEEISDTEYNRKKQEIMDYFFL